MDLAEQCARRVFDLGMAFSADKGSLERRGPSLWEVRIFSPYQLGFELTSTSPSTCSVEAKGGHKKEGHWQMYGSSDVRSIEDFDRFVEKEIGEWPRNRDRLSGKYT